MPGDERRRQKAAERKAARRKEKKQALARSAPAGPRAMLAQAARWPVHECLMTADWQTEGQIVQILVARRSPEGMIGIGVYLVDLACLGVKDAFARVLPSTLDYEDGTRASMMERQALMTTDLDTVARVIREGIGYARSLGFAPHPDYAGAAVMLHGADPDASSVEVPLGINGRPCYFVGPHDNVGRVLNQLIRSVGPGNFDFMGPAEMVPPRLAAQLKLQPVTDMPDA
jgi:hypothetical protein